MEHCEHGYLLKRELVRTVQDRSNERVMAEKRATLYSEGRKSSFFLKGFHAMPARPSEKNDVTGKSLGQDVAKASNRRWNFGFIISVC
jgi:hypothetical protein